MELRRNQVREEWAYARTQLLPDPVGPTTLLDNSSSGIDGNYDDF